MTAFPVAFATSSAFAGKAAATHTRRAHQRAQIYMRIGRVRFKGGIRVELSAHTCLPITVVIDMYICCTHTARTSSVRASCDKSAGHAMRAMRMRTTRYFPCRCLNRQITSHTHTSNRHPHLANHLPFASSPPRKSTSSAPDKTHPAQTP